MNTNPFEFRKNRDFGEIISDTFTFLKQHWKPLVKANLAIGGIYLLATTVCFTTFMLRANGLFTRAANSTIDEFANPITTILKPDLFILVIAALLWVVSIYLVTFGYIAIYMEHDKKQATIADVWEYYKYYFWRGIGAQFLVGLMVAAGFIFCILPGFYIGVVSVLVLPALMFENATPGQAITRSFSLIKGNFWLVLGVTFVLGFIAGIISRVITLPITIISFFLAISHGTKSPLIIQLFSIMASIIGYLFYIILPVGASICYFSIIEKQDGTGLLDRLNNLGNTSAAAAPHDTEASTDTHPDEDF